LFDVLASHGAGLDKIDFSLLGPLVDIVEVDPYLHIFFGSQQHEAGIGGSFGSHAIPGIFEILPTFLAAQVEYKHYTIARFEICGDNGPKLFLACCIPDTQLNFFVLYLDSFIPEVNGGDQVVEGCLIFDVSPEDGGLSGTCISN